MTAIHALLEYTAWTFLLVLIVFLYRGLRFVSGTPINHWPRGEQASGDIPFIKRVADAHANCLENLPLFAVLVLVAAVTNKLPLVDGIAAWAFYARVGQSLAHLSGTGQANVFVRASFWTIQLIVFGIMGYKLMMAA